MTTTVGLVPNWYPPTKENYDFIISLWKWYPIVSSPIIQLTPQNT